MSTVFPVRKHALRLGSATLRALTCKYVVCNSESELRGYFRNAEDYRHWIDLVLLIGEYTLWKLLQSHVDGACSMHQDAASIIDEFSSSHIEKVLQQLMQETLFRSL